MRGGDLHDFARDGRVQVKMLVGVDVVQLQSGGGKGGELGLDLGGQLSAHLGQEKHGGAGARHVGAEMAGGIHQVGNGGWRQDRLAAHQHQVQAHAQARKIAGAGHRIGGCRARHHQAGGGENAV